MRARPKVAVVDFGIYDKENIGELVALLIEHGVAFTFISKPDHEWGMELTVMASPVAPYTYIVFAAEGVVRLTKEGFITHYNDQTY